MFKTTKKLNIILVVALFLMAVVFYFFVFAQNDNLENNSKNISQVCFENKCFVVEIADTTEEREIGLMNRENLEANSGMLFVFDQAGAYNLWMKNTLISLDMIWIDQNNKVVFIKENAEPCETEKCEIFGSDKKALYVLEIGGGIVGEMGVKVGDEICLVNCLEL